VRFTSKGASVYAIVLGTPAHPTLELDVHLAAGSGVHLLGHSAALPWNPTEFGCRVELPETPSVGPALAVRLTGDTPPQ